MHVDASHNRSDIWIHSIWIRRKIYLELSFFQFQQHGSILILLTTSFYFSLAVMSCHFPKRSAQYILETNAYLNDPFRENYDIIINNKDPKYLALLQHTVIDLLSYCLLEGKKSGGNYLVSISGVPNNSYRRKLKHPI